eukprot:gb/GEZJ01008451.1/.p2 GENE.gb/GEZJ01008451.1/~~gb/GEZJ01008451.1/.p2  ORF type:complete len:127 (+),score=6.66 gb/GEZJ01008451.1/:168-548(+)
MSCLFSSISLSWNLRSVVVPVREGKAVEGSMFGCFCRCCCAFPVHSATSLAAAVASTAESGASAVIAAEGSAGPERAIASSAATATTTRNARVMTAVVAAGSAAAEHAATEVGCDSGASESEKCGR